MGPKFRVQKRFGRGKVCRRQQLEFARQNKETPVVEASVEDSRGENITQETSISKNSSASKRKLSFFGFDEADLPATATDNASNVIVTGTQLDLLISKLCCPQCSRRSLKFSYTAYIGLVAKMEVFCPTCQEVVAEEATSPIMKSIDEKSISEVVQRYSKKDTAAMNLTAHEVLNDAAATVRLAYKEMNIEPDGNGILDIAVSYDGSWQKRGHTSNFGVGCVVEIHTGLVLDFAVMSKYCHYCAITKAELGCDTAEFKTWYEKHQGKCDINYKGPSGGMEVAAAKILWQRSMERHHFRYCTMLGDGDARTHNELVAMDVYGGIPIVKEECVNHVSKRLGTALRNTKKSIPSLGGAGGGKLTDDKIKKLTIYYGRAIRNASTVEEMVSSVWATYFHSVSTDSDPHHSRCPQGESSWCFYNRAISKQEAPLPHDKMLGTRLDREVAEHLVPIYKRLSDKNLLERCQAKTQNANESLHSVIWNKCPKTIFLHRARIECGIAIAIASFNKGCRTISSSLEKLGIDAGKICKRIGHQRDSDRIKKAEKAVSAAAKKRRTMQTIAKAKVQEKEKACSSKDYNPGAF